MRNKEASKHVTHSNQKSNISFGMKTQGKKIHSHPGKEYIKDKQEMQGVIGLPGCHT